MNLQAVRKRYLKNTWLRKDAKRTRIENLFTGIWRGYFFQERVAVLRAVRGRTIQAVGVLQAAVSYKTIEVNIRANLNIIQKPLVKKLAKAYTQAGTTIASDAAAGAGFQFPGFPKTTAKWLESYVPKIAGQITMTNKKYILNIVKKGIESGLSNQQIANEIQQFYPDFSDYRVKLIAKQEAANIGAMTEYQMFAAMPVDKNKLTKIWHNAQDNAVRDQHQIEGEPKPFIQKFTNGLRFPHDPLGSAENVINCRCWLEWVMP